MELNEGAGKIELEEGYTVSTVLDGNKHGLNPHSVLPLSFSSSSHLFLLDSAASAFYTLSFPTSPHQGYYFLPLFHLSLSLIIYVYIYIYDVCVLLIVEGLIKKYAGRGVAGFADGELSSAMFNKPKSFALDSKGNVYVADKTNHAIRKIINSGISISISIYIWFSCICFSVAIFVKGLVVNDP